MCGGNEILQYHSRNGFFSRFHLLVLGSGARAWLPQRRFEEADDGSVRMPFRYFITGFSLFQLPTACCVDVISWGLGPGIHVHSLYFVSFSVGVSVGSG